MGHFPLRLGQRNFSGADHLVKEEFKLVLLVSAPFAFSRLRPKVAFIGRMTSNGKRDQVVFLIVLRIVVRIAVGAYLALF